jgi:16S rRNA (cytosine1402-N4)-methyltransferase
MTDRILHYSVLRNEVLQYLKPPLLKSSEFERPLLIDCTLGEGGHSELFLAKLPEVEVLGLDRDSGILERARNRLSGYGSRFNALNVWFDDFFAAPESCGQYRPPAAILFDFGISTYHYEASGRGFSFTRDEPLDMRLDTQSSLTAEYVVNTYDRNRLADIIYEYGEERLSRRIAAAIAARRRERAVTTSADLADIIKGAVPRSYRYGRIHPATRTFQALRIEVNGELERIDRTLRKAVDLLTPEGRIAVISFHSLEDRRVKQTFRDLARGCTCPPEAPRCVCGGKPSIRLLTGKPVKAGDEELSENPASRSARLRCAEKLDQIREDQP